MNWRGLLLFIIACCLACPTRAHAQGCAPGEKLEDGWCVPGEDTSTSKPRTVEPRPEYDVGKARSIKSMTIAGFVLAPAALFTMTFCLGATAMLIPDTDIWPVSASLLGGTALIYTAAVPLLLGAHVTALRAFERRTAFGVNIAGWVGYGLAVSAMVVPGVGYMIGDLDIAFAGTLIAGPLITSSIVLAFISGAFARGIANEIIEDSASSGPTVLPYATAIPGGFAAGIGGVF